MINEFSKIQTVIQSPCSSSPWSCTHPWSQSTAYPSHHLRPLHHIPNNPSIQNRIHTKCELRIWWFNILKKKKKKVQTCLQWSCTFNSNTKTILRLFITSDLPIIWFFIDLVLVNLLVQSGKIKLLCWIWS